MPKPPPIEYFMLRAPTPKELLGEAVAALTKLGLTEVHFDLMTDIPAFARNGKGTHEIKAADFLSTFVAEHATFNRSEVSAYFKTDGRQPSAAYYALSQLLDKGAIKKLDDNGNYTRADVKQIEAPKKEKTKAKPERTRDHFEVDHREFILRYARQHNGRFTMAKMRSYFEAHKRKPSSVGGAVNFLVERKLIKGLGEGEYVLAGKAKLPAKKAPPAKATPLNGTAPAAVTTEAANGNG